MKRGKKPARRPPRPVNVAAKALGQPQFAPRVVRSKKAYDRRREKAAARQEAE
jgi:hypothetical protein